MSESTPSMENGSQENNAATTTSFSTLLKEHDADLIGTKKLQVASFHRNPENLSLAATAIFETSAKDAIEKQGRFVVSLCGGRAPKALFEHLKDASIDWSKVHFFWGDERPPRPDVGQTNYEAAAENFLQYINIPKENIHKLNLELSDREQVARNYAEDIRNTLGPDLQFDLMLVGGGGKDQLTGHTMGIMANSEVFNKENPDLVEVISRNDTGFGYTMSPEMLEKAKLVIALLPGEEKIEVVNELIKPKKTPKEYPILLLNNRPANKTIVMTDQKGENVPPMQ